MNFDLQHCYWEGTGKYSSAVEQLNKLIPESGSVTKPRSANKLLERYRKATNCYYDLYNNGLMNMMATFRSVFHIAAGRYRIVTQHGHNYYPEFYQLVEDAYDDIILSAAKEQNILVDILDK